MLEEFERYGNLVVRDPMAHDDLRDRALIGLMVFSFARSSACSASASRTTLATYPSTSSSGMSSGTCMSVICISHRVTDVLEKCVHLGLPACEGANLLSLKSHCIRKRFEIAIDFGYAVERVLPLLKSSSEPYEVLPAAHDGTDRENRCHYQCTKRDSLYRCRRTYLSNRRAGNRSDFYECHCSNGDP